MILGFKTASQARQLVCLPYIQIIERIYALAIYELVAIPLPQFTCNPVWLYEIEFIKKQLCVCVYISVRVCVYMYVCIYTHTCIHILYVCVWDVHTYIHTHIFKKNLLSDIMYYWLRKRKGGGKFHDALRKYWELLKNILSSEKCCFKISLSPCN